VTFVLGEEEFELPKPFVAIHSPSWAERFDNDAELVRYELDGDPSSFRVFIEFLKGEGDAGGKVTADNVLHLLHWGKEFGVDYISASCEDFLLSEPHPNIDYPQKLDIAARHNMPLLYARTTEVLAHGMHWVEVPEASDRDLLPPIFDSTNIRDDLLGTHVKMGMMRNDGEMRGRYRFADHNLLDGPKQRGRLLWKTRKRFVPPLAKDPEHDWKSCQTVWPHHSLRGPEWTTVSRESQPTMPLRSRGILDASATGSSSLKRA